MFNIFNYLYIPSKTLQSFVRPFSVSHLLTKAIIILHVLKQPRAFDRRRLNKDILNFTLLVQFPHPTQAKSNSPPTGWPFRSNSQLPGQRKCLNARDMPPPPPGGGGMLMFRIDRRITEPVVR